MMDASSGEADRSFTLQLVLWLVAPGAFLMALAIEGILSWFANPDVGLLTGLALYGLVLLASVITFLNLSIGLAHKFAFLIYTLIAFGPGSTFLTIFNARFNGQSLS
jgi:hypothetical protein